MSYQVNIVIEEDSDGFYAYCPQLEGCQSQDDSLEEVTQNIHEAVELYIETLKEDGKPIPEPSIKAKLVHVAA